MASEEIVLEGHIIDSLTLPKVMDAIVYHDGDFEVMEIRVGRTRDAESYARLKVTAPDAATLDAILELVGPLGARILDNHDVRTAPAPRDGALPDDFYSTTNLETQVRIQGQWVPVANTEMDLAIVVDGATGTAAMKPMSEVKAGEAVAVGHSGIRVTPLARLSSRDVFSFMNSDVSSEKPKAQVIQGIAQEMRELRERGGRVCVVAGPAIVHSGASPWLAALIRDGYVQALLGGNAVATHDVEHVLYGTSLGVDIAKGSSVEGGHNHHMRALNAIRRAGSLRAAVDQGILTQGIMVEAIRAGITMVLAGSIRDDGPMPDVITDVVEAQRQMRAALRGVDMVLMICSMLHSIAVGNLLPASVRVVAVDINPSVVVKLADRGTFQAVGLVTDAELFLRELGEALGVRP